MLLFQSYLLGEKFWYPSDSVHFSGFAHCAAGVLHTVGSWRKYSVHNFYFFFIIWQLLVAKCMNLWCGFVDLLLW